MSRQKKTAKKKTTNKYKKMAKQSTKKPRTAKVLKSKQHPATTAAFKKTKTKKLKNLKPKNNKATSLSCDKKIQQKLQDIAEHHEPFAQQAKHLIIILSQGDTAQKGKALNFAGELFKKVQEYQKAQNSQSSKVSKELEEALSFFENSNSSSSSSSNLKRIATPPERNTSSSTTFNLLSQSPRTPPPARSITDSQLRRRRRSKSSTPKYPIVLGKYQIEDDVYATPVLCSGVNQFNEPCSNSSAYGARYGMSCLPLAQKIPWCCHHIHQAQDDSLEKFEKTLIAPDLITFRTSYGFQRF